MTTTSSHTTTAVALRGVSRGYGRGATAVRAVDDVDVEFRRGTWTAVMGPSGSGKSTLLHLAAGLERADSGRVLLGDTDITAASDNELTALRRTRIGFVFQSFNLIGSLTAEQNVALPLRLAKRRPGRARVRQALDQVGLGDRARHRPRELSGGQQQRVAIARALAASPRLLIADEPTGQLDAETGLSVMALLRAVVESEGVTALVSTHDPVMMALADRVIRINDGRLDGPEAA